MATLFRPGDVWKIQLSFNSKRHTLSIGKVKRNRAKEILGIVERLHEAAVHKRRPDATSLALVEELPLKVQGRLGKIGLLKFEQAISLGELCEYACGLDGAESTQKKRNNLKINLTEFFSEDQLISEILPGDADDFRRWLARKGGRRKGEDKNQGLAQATVSRRCGMAKSWFKMALRKGWIKENPFEDQQRESEANGERDYFVDLDITRKLFDACKDTNFRLVLALARYGGLRCPSEIKPLRWEWFDWEEQVIYVRSKKTQRHKGKDIRQVPMFPQLRPYIDAVWEQAESGQELVFPSLPTTLTDRLETLCRRCGIVLWPKPWQNMRSTRETELVGQFPIHVATAWIGNSITVAEKHYLQVTKEHLNAALEPESAAVEPSETPGAAKALHSAATEHDKKGGAE